MKLTTFLCTSIVASFRLLIGKREPASLSLYVWTQHNCYPPISKTSWFSFTSERAASLYRSGASLCRMLRAGFDQMNSAQVHTHTHAHRERKRERETMTERGRDSLIPGPTWSAIHLGPDRQEHVEKDREQWLDLSKNNTGWPCLHG